MSRPAILRRFVPEPSDVPKLGKQWVKPTDDGQPMREAMSVPSSWVLGSLPFPPTPAERHVEVDVTTNPAPEHADQRIKRMEWRAHKQAERALARGHGLEPIDGGPVDHRPFRTAQMHHPDYRKPMEIEWVAPVGHPHDHKPEDRGQERENPTATAVERLNRAFRALGVTPSNPIPILIEGLALGAGSGLTTAEVERKLHPRENPCPDAAAEKESQQFHGKSEFTRCVNGEGLVDIGEVREIEYEAPKGSQRAGLWDHKIGGDLTPSGKRITRKVRGPELVADPHTGKVELVGGATRFDARMGLRK